MSTKITRRKFLKGATAAAGGVIAASGLPPSVLASLSQPAARAKIGRRAPKLTVICFADDRPWMEYVGRQYEELYGGTLEIISQAYDATHSKIVSALVGGTKVDIVEVDTVWGAEFAEAGFLAPVTDHLSQEVIDSLVPHSLDPWNYKGEQWAVPSSYYFKFYYYNQKKLEAAGIGAPPTTYEELVSMSQQLMEAGHVEFGQSWGWTQAEGLICDWQQLMQAFGGDWSDGAGNWTLNQGGAVAALEYMVSNLKNKTFDPASPTLNDRTTIDPFMQGDSAFMTNWGFAWNLVNDPSMSQVVDQVKLAVNPGSSAANVVSTSCGGGAGIGITENCEEKDMAWEVVGLISGVSSPENDVAKLSLIGTPPVRNASWEDPAVIEQYPYFAEIIKQAPYMRHRPVLPWYSEFSEIVQIELSKALGGEKEPQEALDDAVAALSAKGKP